MTILVDRNCVHRDPSDGLNSQEITSYRAEVPDWKMVEIEKMGHIQRSFKFRNFAKALAFTNRVGEISERQDHHPSIVTEWGRVQISWWTHTVKGLSENDFIMAAKTNALFAQSEK